MLEQAMGCVGQLLQSKLLAFPKRMLTLVTEIRGVSLKHFSPMFPWLPCKAIISLRAVSLTLVISKIFKVVTSHFQKPLLMGEL